MNTEQATAQRTRQVEVTVVFDQNYRATERTIVNIGGSRSSKSHSIAQLMVKKFNEEKNKNLLTTRKTLPALRTTAYRVAVDMMKDYGCYQYFTHNKSERTIYNPYKNNLWIFTSIDDPEKIKCFHPDTEILTEDGFAKVDKVELGQRVATLNPKTGKAEYRPVTKAFKYDYEGRMFTYRKGKRKPYMDFCITPEHKIIGQRRVHRTNSYRMGCPEFIKVRDLPCRFYIPRSAVFDGRKASSYEIPRNDWNDNKTKGNKNGRKITLFPLMPWLKFLGWYLSEGSLGSRKRYEINISQSNEQRKKEIRGVLNAFPYKFWEKKDGFVLAGKDLFRYLSKFGKSNNKYIPRDILDLHPKLLRHLFDALMAGDGYQCKTGRWQFGSCSFQLINDVSELAIKLGLIPAWWEVDVKKHYPNTKNRFWAMSIKKQDKAILERDNLQEMSYKGKVYCIEVPPHHTVLTRYNGRIMWIGQSTEYNYIHMEETNEFTYDDYMILKLRMSGEEGQGEINQIYLSLNPSQKYGWVNDKLLPQKGVKVIHSTYLDAIKFLPASYIKWLEGLKDEDASYWHVYGLGLFAEIKGMIHKLHIIPTLPKEPVETVYGLDFGFVNPNALLQIDIDMENMSLYLTELLYQTGMTNADLKEKLKEKIPKEHRGREIYADSAEPARIEEISLEGFNIHKANKSVVDGIDCVNRFTLYSTEESPNVNSEVRGYKRKVDRNGRVLEEPVKFKDHFPNTLRYGAYTHLWERLIDAEPAWTVHAGMKEEEKKTAEEEKPMRAPVSDEQKAPEPVAYAVSQGKKPKDAVKPVPDKKEREDSDWTV